MPPTPTRRLADRLIKGGVDAFIAAQRAENKSWRLIARALFDTTKGEIDVTPETVRKWCTVTEDAA